MIDITTVSSAFKLGFEDTSNSERENSDPFSEAFVQVLFLGSERLNGSPPLAGKTVFRERKTAPRPARSRPWLLRAGRSHRPGSRLQRQVARAFAARGDRLTTTDLVGYCYPKVRTLRGGHYRSIWRAVRRVADCLGRAPHARGRPNVWVLKGTI